MSDFEHIRQQFPGLSQTIENYPLVYLDNAATSQKPTVVLEAIDRAYRLDCANVHRGIHPLAERATESYENARLSCARFLNAPQAENCIFVRGATEGINLVASTWGRHQLHAGDKILITRMEHHANIVPWQMLAQEMDLILLVADINDDGSLDMAHFKQLLAQQPKLVSFCWISNVLGTINPARELIALAKQVNAITLVDACQRAPHGPMDVQALDCDFLVFSGHKVFGPTGIGVLYGKMALLESMPPYQGGGEMIDQVLLPSGTSFAGVPHRFEAGTPHIAGAAGLGAALEWLMQLDWQKLASYEQQLLQRLQETLLQQEGITLLGTHGNKVPIYSFAIEGIPAYDLVEPLGKYGVALRSGHHCAMPLIQRFGLSSTLRASATIYNTFEDIERMGQAITKARRFF